VDELQKFVVDDENDTLLFNRLQQHVLEQYPNPERVGCFDHETLVAFVETPGKLDLEDPKYLHVFQCAECTRELMELRRLREERLSQARRSRSSRTWQFATLAAAVVLVAAIGFVGWRYRSGRSTETASNLGAVPINLDLSAAGISRDAGEQGTETLATLPARRVDLHLVLPFYSPGGRYRVTITRDRTLRHPEAEAWAPAVVSGSHAELTVPLDLLHLSTGTYFLGTLREDDGGPYFYQVTIQR